MRNKILNTLNIIVNATLSVCCCVSLALIFFNYRLDGFYCLSPYITFLTLISSIIAIHYNVKVYNADEESVSKSYKVFHLSVVALNASLVILIGALSPKMFIDTNFLTSRIIIPAVSIISFLFIEYNHKFSFHSAWATPIFFVAYFGVMFTLQCLDKLPSNYEWYYNLAIYGVVIVGSVIVTVLLNGYNLLLHWLTFKKHKKEENKREVIIIPTSKKEDKIDPITAQLEALKTIEKEQASQEEIIEEKIDNNYDQIKENQDTETNENNDEEVMITKPIKLSTAQENIESEVKEETQESKEENDENLDEKIYHISHHPTENKWQVKAEGAARAKKLFLTQGEAITYAKILVKTKGGQIRIHSINGRIRNG